MISNMMNKGDSSYRKTERDKEIIINKIRKISIIVACVIFFFWFNFFTIYGLYQSNLGFFDCSFLCTWLFIFDIAYWNICYPFLKMD